MFRPIKQNRASEDVVNQIQEAILQGRLKVGDKLPSERKLTELFKVSRGTFREALRSLEQKKLITIKKGVKGGAIVRDMDTENFSNSLDLLLQYQKITLRELAEFREAIEGLAAARVAQQSRKKDIKRLDVLLKSFENKVNADDPNWDEIVEAEKEFHLELAQIGGNRIFRAMLHTVYDNITRYFERFLPKERWVMEEGYRDLYTLLEAIKKRKPDEASALIQQHIRRFSRVMEQAGGKGSSKRNLRE